MVQRTVLKVQITCRKCKKKLLKAVSALQGVDKVEADADKGTLTVTGDADPYEVILRARKVGRFVDVVSIGPLPAPKKDGQKDDKKVDEKDDKKKDDKKKCDAMLPVPYGCACERMPIIPMGCVESHPTCSIM